MEVFHLTYPPLIRQPRWVLQSASADRPGPEQLNREPDDASLEAWELIKPGWDAFQVGDTNQAKVLWKEAAKHNSQNLLLMRTINQYAPELLIQAKIKGIAYPWRSRIAVVIPGELRCYLQSLKFLRALSRKANVFICTSREFADATKNVRATDVEIIQSEPKHPMGAMQQWHKLAVTLSMVRAHEKRTGIRYTHIVKLRSDFYHVQPQNLLNELVAADGLICSSDKVFGGSREIMMLFEGFYQAIHGWFDQKEQNYWPINVQTILRSDDSCKWYGMNFPRELVGEPSTVENLRETLAKGGQELADSLQKWKTNSRSEKQEIYMKQLHRLIQGNPRFASEICFARFLNFNGISTHNSPGVLGFLRSDRHNR